MLPSMNATTSLKDRVAGKRLARFSDGMASRSSGELLHAGLLVSTGRSEPAGLPVEGHGGGGTAFRAVSGHLGVP